VAKLYANENFPFPVPQGHSENSPAFQRWDRLGQHVESRRDGRCFPFGLILFRPSRTRWSDFEQPSVETLGYFRRVWRIPTGFRRKAQGWEARAELPWVNRSRCSQPQRGCVTQIPPGRNPVGVVPFHVFSPRVSRSSQPWALRRNPVGIGDGKRTDSVRCYPRI